MGDRATLHRLWEKWALPFISVSGDKPLTGAALINVSADRPSRFYTLIVEQEVLSFKPSGMRPMMEAIRNNSLHTDYFYIGPDKYLVTAILENVYCARCVNARNLSGCGVIISRHAPFIIIATYEGAVCEACKAAEVVESFLDQLSQAVA
ncbi:hypothetical protein SELMODRAFT_431596 [Selaginella moellendorffii]|uniref:Profilin n=1 Tax=Selaginella moellendorffii TaxID=88036 RepID=D8TD58_SELML|nr:uncharacterized protein LOC9663359 [Selaginella moellendorffii]XP_024536353.1 uncharacterized protein LOC9630043 [Selaginella moellendorffii]EFJ05422.1 hypothetical protein SELMODRAFT_431596 [Selaginella moellendorffii]|eukprot:XP_002993530.1 uncharacterized protein LOC9663359 [Selaginella moellendorffii]